MTTYTALLARIQQYTENDESTFVSEIPDMVRRVEKRIARIINVPVVTNNSTIATTSSNPLVTAPTDILFVNSAYITASSTNYFLQWREPEFIREAFLTSTTGRPRLYGWYDDDQFVLGPTPDAIYTINIKYGAYPASIVDTPGSELWMGENCEDALLYGTLVEAAANMKAEADTVQMYQQRWMESLEELKGLYGARRLKDTYLKPDLKGEI